MTVADAEAQWHDRPHRPCRHGKPGAIEQATHAWFAGFGKLRICFERRLDLHTAFISRCLEHLFFIC
ncbi:hypothetical protein [Ralstonia pseudosolanacearum]|uniref:hypothetical protein n=1 Tax=Ralstonia pseudosolanacearum TaxID=1310165 RepID=UPI00339B3F38